MNSLDVTFVSAEIRHNQRAIELASDENKRYQREISAHIDALFKTVPFQVIKDQRVKTPRFQICVKESGVVWLLNQQRFSNWEPIYDLRDKTDTKADNQILEIIRKTQEAYNKALSIQEQSPFKSPPFSSRPEQI